uniref:CSON009600 protein n=1 Tax=Culicoides sonorensis TaxID=179676 RepID=A0A336M394_CULSO
MLIKSTFYVILILLIQFSYQFFLHSHHKLQKYHRNTITSNKNPCKRNKHMSTQFISGQNPIEFQSYAHQIDIRGAFSEPQTFSGQEIQRTAICDIKIDDFHDATLLERAFCAADNELIVFQDPGNQFYCIGYLESEKRSKKNGILALKFDRSYQVQYSPGRIKTEKSSNLGMKFYMDQRSLNTILIKGGYEGLPLITEIEFEGKKICKSGKTKIKIQSQASFDSSEEENIPLKQMPRQEFDSQPNNRPIAMPSTPHAHMKVPSTMDCLESNRDFYGAFLYEGNFCAGHLEYKSVACTGDSGGGLYFNVNGVWIVRGIVSIAIREDDEDDGCSPNNYVLYTDIYKHMTWINGKM